MGMPECFLFFFGLVHSSDIHVTVLLIPSSAKHIDYTRPMTDLANCRPVGLFKLHTSLTFLSVASIQNQFKPCPQTCLRGALYVQ